MDRPPNPHFQRLTPHDSGFTAAVGATLGFIFHFLVLQGLFANLYDNNSYLIITLMPALAVPPMIALYAARFTAQHCRRENYEWLYLTSLSNAQLVWGYVRAVTQRTGFLVGFQRGIVIIHTVIVIFIWRVTVLFEEEVFSTELAVSLLGPMTGLLVFNRLPVALGVGFGLRFRHVLYATLSALLLTLLLFAIWVQSSMRLVLPVFLDASSPETVYPPVIALLATPYLGSLGITLMSYRWARLQRG